MARILWFVGGLLVAAGLVMHFAPGLLTWFGKLPGDIRIETPYTKVFIPVTSMVIASVALTIIINLFFRR